MDSSLLREREAFKRKAMALPTVENKNKKAKETSKSSSSSAKAKAGAPQSQSAKARLDLQQMKSVAGGGGSSQFRFGVLAKIVRHMRQRHMEGEDHPLKLDEILDETHQLDVGSKTRAWLANEALKNNPKISADSEGTYIYKPPYEVRRSQEFLTSFSRKDGLAEDFSKLL